jgi:hypothetical protein
VKSLRRRRWSSSASGVALIALAWSAAPGGCVPRSDSPIQRISDGDGGPVLNLDGGTAADASNDLAPVDPHALLGIDPARGPFRGGTRALLRGNGFNSSARVWFGEVEADASSVLAIDPGRVQVTVPPGRVGTVDVTLQNGDDDSTRRTLEAAYTYEQFYAEPAKGPTAGGTLITLRGEATAWDERTRVTIDNKPCELVAAPSASEISCRTPPGTPGTKPIRVVDAGGITSDALDGFSYVDSDNGYRGGLSGDPLKGTLRVLVLDSFKGEGLGGATVVAGDAVPSALVKQTEANGTITFDDASLTGARSVTVAKKCFQPVTFVDVPVDTVTVYLDPVLSPSCAESLGGIPPSGGGGIAYAATVEGELVWEGRREFERDGWTNVPPLKSADEQHVAYVLPLVDDAAEKFVLPPAYEAVRPTAGGDRGFEFRLSSSAGNLALYAVAGIENRKLNPPVFIAYAMGLARGVLAQPGETTQEVFIPVDIPLDHGIALAVDAPAPTPRGPDRVDAHVSVRVGDLGFSPLPGGSKVELLPLAGPMRVVGLPPLTGALASAEYVASTRAHTGNAGLTPRSVIGALSTTVSGQTLAVGGFVEIPVLTAPTTNASWNGVDLSVEYAAGGAAVDMLLYEIESGGGLSTWTVVVPNGAKQARVPDLSQLGADLGLFRGSISVRVTAANIVGFDYAALRYRQLGRSGWTAHATDVFYAQY